LRHLLDKENAAAFEQARAWAAQLILEQRTTQILVVADSPAQNRPVNRRVESELSRLHADYRLTDPVEIRGPGPARIHSSARETQSSSSYSHSTG
jgi:hypothetical protein